MAETDSLPIDQVESARQTRRPGSTVPVGEIDYSLVTDGLEAERDQGITIDVAYRHLYLPSGRRAILADAPATFSTPATWPAASTADVAILLADAGRGTRDQTHRHLAVCALMGCGTSCSPSTRWTPSATGKRHTKKIVDEIRVSAAAHGVEDVVAIPVSALTGANVVTASDEMVWYRGPTLLAALDSLVLPSEAQAGLRLPVQTIIRAEGFRGYGGSSPQERSRRFEGKVADSGQTAVVSRIVSLVGDESAEGGRGVGRILGGARTRSGPRHHPWRCSPAMSTMRPSRRQIRCRRRGMAEQPLAPGRSYTLRAGPLEVPATVTRIRHRLDVTDGTELAARTLEMNDVGRIELATNRMVPLDQYQRSHDTGGFVLVDRVSGDSLAAGLTRFSLRRSANVTEHHSASTGKPGRRSTAPGRGCSGSPACRDRVNPRSPTRWSVSCSPTGYVATSLDGDSVRHGLTKDLGFTPADRAENVRRVAEVARLMMDAGIVVLVCLVSPSALTGAPARALFGRAGLPGGVRRHPLTCASPATLGLYAKAREGRSPTCRDSARSSEAPSHPDVYLDGELPVTDNATTVLSELGLD